jgi:hypothetical protein
MMLAFVVVEWLSRRHRHPLHWPALRADALGRLHSLLWLTLWNAQPTGGAFIYFQFSDAARSSATPSSAALSSRMQRPRCSRRSTPSTCAGSAERQLPRRGLAGDVRPPPGP